MTWPHPCPHRILTHLPPHATTTTVPHPHLTLIHIAHSSTHNHKGKPLCHTCTYSMCHINFHTLQLSPMSACVYACSESHPAPPHPSTRNNNNSASPSFHPHLICPSIYNNNSTLPSSLLTHIVHPSVLTQQAISLLSFLCPHTTFTWFHGMQMCVSSRLFHTHDVLVVATVIMIYDHLERVWRWSRDGPECRNAC